MKSLNEIQIRDNQRPGKDNYIQRPPKAFPIIWEIFSLTLFAIAERNRNQMEELS